MTRVPLPTISMRRSSPRLVMSKRTGRYPAAVGEGHSESRVTRSASTSNVRYSPAAWTVVVGDATVIRNSAATAVRKERGRRRTLGGLQRLREPALQFRERVEHRRHDSAAIPPFELCRIVEDEPVRQSRCGDALHFVEPDVWLATHQRQAACGR